MCISLKNTVSWGMNPCSLIDVFRRLRRSLCQTTRRQSQNAGVFIFTNMRTSDLTYTSFWYIFPYCRACWCSTVFPCSVSFCFYVSFVFYIITSSAGDMFQHSFMNLCRGLLHGTVSLSMYLNTFHLMKLLYTVELHLSGLIRTASHPDMQ